MSCRKRPLIGIAIPVVAVAVCAVGLRIAHAHVKPEAPVARLVPHAVLRATFPPKARTTPTPVPPVTAVYTLSVDGRTRRWLQLTPEGPAGVSTPILVVLHGQAVTPDQEVERDGFVALVAQGKAELAYPEGIGESWNAGGCCGPAGAQNVDDVGFLRALVAEVDPRHARPIHLVGYSNGGRLAYTIACDDPTLVDDFAVVDAMPVSGCTLGQPVSVLQVDGTADPAIPYQPGDPGGEQPPATTQAVSLGILDGCTGSPDRVQTGNLTVSSWNGCRNGTRVAFATYHGATHLWPAGDATTPGGAATIWSFASGKAPS